MMDFEDFEENEFDEEEYQRVKREQGQQMPRYQTQYSNPQPQSVGNNQTDRKSGNYGAAIIVGIILIGAFIWLMIAGGSLVTSIIVVGGGAYLLAKWILR